jgi:tRNA (cmo5U34)-methyltransferase
MPPRHRRSVLEQVYRGLNHGGAFIFAEKTVCEDPRMQDMLTFNYYDYKRKHFTTEDIMDKERTLRHMMKPNTWKELVSTISVAGFSIDKIQPFWRNHTFVGAIVIK